MIAIPDFAAGAMENYGLVTYRETALLYDDKHSAAANKQRVMLICWHLPCYYSVDGSCSIVDPSKKTISLSHHCSIYYRLITFVLMALGCNCSSSWTCTPMVWQSRDNGMVDPSMAEWGVCNMGMLFDSMCMLWFVDCSLFTVGGYSVCLCQVSYLAADGLFPEWSIWTQFLDESTEGLRLDGLAESHPIEVKRVINCLFLFSTFMWAYQLVKYHKLFSFQVDINHASEIDEIFDAISYRKGASLIRMLQSYLGAERFQVCHCFNVFLTFFFNIFLEN